MERSEIRGRTAVPGSLRYTRATGNGLDRARCLQLRNLLRLISQRLQNLLIMFSKLRRRGADRAIEAGHLTRLRHQLDFAEAGMGDGAREAQFPHLRVGEGVLDA